jgi:hypothetical protein
MKKPKENNIGRTKLRWEDNVKRYLDIIVSEGVEWNDLVEDM